MWPEVFPLKQVFSLFEELSEVTALILQVEIQALREQAEVGPVSQGCDLQG